MTWELAARSALRGIAAIAGLRILAAGGLSPRDIAGLLLLAVIAAGVYLLGCLVWPYGPCLACRLNRGRNFGSNSRRHGRCRVCRGTGERLRFGTRLIRAWTGGRWPR